MRSRVDAITADNDDQNLLALWKTAQHPKVRDLFRRLRLTINSDEVSVGLRLLRGVQRITHRLKDTMKSGITSGGRSKDCRTLKEIIAMQLAAGKVNEGEGVECSQVSDRSRCL